MWLPHNFSRRALVYIYSIFEFIFEYLFATFCKLKEEITIIFELKKNNVRLWMSCTLLKCLFNSVDRLWEQCKRMIFIPKTSAKSYAIGHWPIPEDYWLPLNAQSLPKRSAHPTIKFKCEASDAMAIDEIPFDKYELEPSPLTQFILERRQPNVAWQCFVPNSGPKPNDLGYPFGYIKASTNMMSVNLFVLPYNYPVLFQLISKPRFQFSIGVSSQQSFRTSALIIRSLSVRKIFIWCSLRKLN